MRGSVSLPLPQFQTRCPVHALPSRRRTPSIANDVDHFNECEPLSPLTIIADAPSPKAFEVVPDSGDMSSQLTDFRRAKSQRGLRV